MTVLIQLTIADADTGPLFNLFSDVNNYSSPFESGVSKTALLEGYTSTIVPGLASIIRVKSTGKCLTYADIQID
jgi:hypothetical protein